MRPVFLQARCARISDAGHVTTLLCIGDCSVECVVPLKFVDLFAGVGGFHLALEREFGAECVFACDIDLDCRAVYERNFGIPVAGDIRPLTEGATVAIPDHDVLCAGFPCQPFSKSGFQRGINEARGTLFYNILRILEAKRPRYAILENVRNLAGPRHRETWGRMITLLRGLGYRVASEPTVLSPHRLPRLLGGTPQVRERVFILCELAGSGNVTEPAFDVQAAVRAGAAAIRDPMEWNIDEYLQADVDIPDVARYQLRPDEIRWLDIWNELLRCLPSGERLPGFPMWADHFVANPRISSDTPPWKADFLLKNSQFYLRHRRTIDAWLARHGGLRDIPPSRRKFEWQAQDATRDVWQLVIHMRPSGIRVKRGTYLPALVAITQTSIIGWRRRRITPREAARLQGFPDEFELHDDDAVAYRQLGNAVNVGVVRYVARALVDDDIRSQAALKKAG